MDLNHPDLARSDSRDFAADAAQWGVKNPPRFRFIKQRNTT
jgi:hypothetical protein